MLPGEKKGSKLFFMCPELIIIVLLERQSLQVGGKVSLAHMLCFWFCICFIVYVLGNCD